jgi:hypothetical protein
VWLVLYVMVCIVLHQRAHEGWSKWCRTEFPKYHIPGQEFTAVYLMAPFQAYHKTNQLLPLRLWMDWGGQETKNWLSFTTHLLRKGVIRDFSAARAKFLFPLFVTKTKWSAEGQLNTFSWLYWNCWKHWCNLNVHGDALSIYSHLIN